MTTAIYEVYGVRHAYITYNNSGTIAYKRAYYTSKCDMKVNNGKLKFAGDGKSFERAYGYAANGTLEFDLEDDTVDSILFATPVVSPSGGDIFSKRYIRGTDAEMQTNYVGLMVTLDAANHDTGAVACVRYNILKVQFSPDTPPAFQTETKLGRMLSWNAHQSATDIAGVTPTGMPTRGAFWIKDIITNSANFDPVSGDND